MLKFNNQYYTCETNCHITKINYTVMAYLQLPVFFLFFTAICQDNIRLELMCRVHFALSVVVEQVLTYFKTVYLSETLYYQEISVTINR